MAVFQKTDPEDLNINLLQQRGFSYWTDVVLDHKYDNHLAESLSAQYPYISQQ